jgi:hypothetical protein
MQKRFELTGLSVVLVTSNAVAPSSAISVILATVGPASALPLPDLWVSRKRFMVPQRFLDLLFAPFDQVHGHACRSSIL